MDLDITLYVAIRNECRKATSFGPFSTKRPRIVGLYYLILVLIFSYLVSKLEKRLQNKTRGSERQAKKLSEMFAALKTGI
jgi:hypothetical protein